jgi:hypothetical protein
MSWLPCRDVQPVPAVAASQICQHSSGPPSTGEAARRLSPCTPACLPAGQGRVAGQAVSGSRRQHRPAAGARPQLHTLLAPPATSAGAACGHLQQLEANGPGGTCILECFPRSCSRSRSPSSRMLQGERGSGGGAAARRPAPSSRGPPCCRSCLPRPTSARTRTPSSSSWRKPSRAARCWPGAQARDVPVARWDAAHPGCWEAGRSGMRMHQCACIATVLIWAAPGLQLWPPSPDALIRRHASSHPPPPSPPMRILQVLGAGRRARRRAAGELLRALRQRALQLAGGKCRPGCSPQAAGGGAPPCTRCTRPGRCQAHASEPPTSLSAPSAPGAQARPWRRQLRPPSPAAQRLLPPCRRPPAGVRRGRQLLRALPQVPRPRRARLPGEVLLQPGRHGRPGV